MVMVAFPDEWTNRCRVLEKYSGYFRERMLLWGKKAIIMRKGTKEGKCKVI